MSLAWVGYRTKFAPFRSDDTGIRWELHRKKIGPLRSHLSMSLKAIESDTVRSRTCELQLPRVNCDRFRDNRRHLSKIADFSTPTHLTFHVSFDYHRNFIPPFGFRLTTALPYGEKRLTTCAMVSTNDGQIYPSSPIY